VRIRSGGIGPESGVYETRQLTTVIQHQ
jgi:hypothetical protein